ncbi:MAG: hypothetical protein WCG97_03925 [bacterium]
MLIYNHVRKPTTTNSGGRIPIKTLVLGIEFDDKDAIQIDIFDSNEKLGPVEFALDNIKDQETARGILLRFKRYLAVKREGKKESIKVEANDLIALVGNALDKILDAE